MAKDFWTSISAITDAAGKDGRGGCIRRFAFNKIFKLPTPRRKATIFGDIHHAVIARYLLANDRGLDVHGQPVNLYPDGWMSATEKFGADKTVYSITDGEAALIQQFLNISITDGILIREPGRLVELPIDRVLFEESRIKAVCKGSIDLDTPTRIEDHKTVSDMKYALSLAKLREDIQMMTYAWDKYERGHQTDLWLAQNIFLKDLSAPKVTKREILVSRPEVYQFFQDVTLPIIKRMFQIYRNYRREDVIKWRELSPANDTKECNFHYGKQCSYVTICTGSCSVATYLEKFGSSMKDYVETDIKEQKGSPKIMSSLMDKIKEQQAKQAANITATVAAAAPVAAPIANPAPAAVAPVAPPTATAPVAVSPLLAMLQKNQAAMGQTAMPAVVQSPVQAPVAATPAPAQVTPTVAIAPPAASVPAKPQAPWYMEHLGIPCNACKDNEVLGFNSKGGPCQICDARAKAAGKPTSDCYSVTVDGSQIVYTLKAVVQTPAAPAAAPVTVQPTAQPATSKVQTEMVPMQAPAEVAPVAAFEPFGKNPMAAPVQAPVAAPKAPAQPVASPSDPWIDPMLANQAARKSFTLLLGCAMIEKSPNGHVVHGDQLLQETMQVIAQVAGKDGASIEHFALMGAIDAYAPAIAETLAGKVVVCFTPGKGSALARLIDGIRPYASTVIVPMAL